MSDWPQTTLLLSTVDDMRVAVVWETPPMVEETIII